MADTTGICTSCGMSKDPGGAYCVHCGAPVTASAATGAGAMPLPQAPPPPEQAGTRAPSSSASGVGHDAGLRTQRGFFASLFDVSFTSLVMTKIIKALYVLSMIWIGLSALLYIILAFHTSGALGLLMLFIIAPAISLLLLIYTRLLLELSIAIFRIMENTSELVAQGLRD
jgi:Domain of unknown function (DUF4282)